MIHIAETLRENPLSPILRQEHTRETRFSPLTGFKAELLLEQLKRLHKDLARRKEHAAWPAELQVNEHNRKQLLMACASFAQDPEALERFGMRPNRGILLSGPSSVGKSHLLFLFQQLLNRFNGNCSFGRVEVQKILHEFEQGGDRAIVNYSSRKHPRGHYMDYAYDDILSERGGRHFGGPEVRFMTEVIHNREKLFYMNGVLTHFTTNHRSEVMKEVYMERTFERILGMCDPIVFPADATRWRSYSPDKIER